MLSAVFSLLSILLIDHPSLFFDSHAQRCISLHSHCQKNTEKRRKIPKTNGPKTPNIVKKHREHSVKKQRKTMGTIGRKTQKNIENKWLKNTEKTPKTHGKH
jgi:hypothetical protein